MTSIRKLGIIAAAVAYFAAAAGSSAFAQETITIWTKEDKAFKGLAKVGQWFTKDTGIKVVVEHPDDASGKFQTAVPAGEGPDALWWAHDMAGQWAAGGLLHPVKPQAKVKRSLAGKGWEAFTIKGQTWGYPLALEAVGLVCNKALVPRPPASFQGFLALHKKLSAQGKKAIMWDYNNTYFTMGVLHAHGGYAFKRNANGTYNDGDVGVNNPGAVRGLELIVDMITKGVMPKGAKYSDMESAMIKGNLGCMINGNWSWQNLRDNNIAFTVSKLPSVSGKPARPFVGVQGIMISSASKNKQATVKFIEKYVLSPKGLQMLNDDVALGVPAHTGFYRQLSKDPLIRATFANARVGVLMPNTAKMGSFWSAMQAALENATNGRQSAKDALDGAYKRIKAP